MKCLLDLDGIVADFHTQWYRYHPEHSRVDPKGEWFLHKLHGITFEESCKKLDLSFWETIPWTVDGREIVTLLEETFGQDNICILTSNNVQPGADIAAMGKVRWIERELPEYRTRYFLGANKHFIAHCGALLIDDRDKNIEDFRKEEGDGFLYPRSWNSRYRRAHHAIDDLKGFLRPFVKQDNVDR
jgi:hypothetical protein